jgi:mono/diheme cytochrome c family protein
MDVDGEWETTMHYRLPAVMLISLVLAAAAAHPAPADVTKGGQLAQVWCANCHVTSGTSAGNVQQGPPSFRTIAGVRTADQLRAFLSHPHGAMPDLSLTRAEIDDLVGYIQTLR